MKPFIPYKEELAHILTLEKGQTFVIARPVGPQPNGELMDYAEHLEPIIPRDIPCTLPRHTWIDEDGDIFKSPFGKEGDEFFVQEEWVKYLCVEYDEQVFEIKYKHSGECAYLHADEWEPASAMPQWASRRTIRNAGTECKRVWDLTIEEQKKLGCLEPNNFMAPLHQEQWQSRYGDQYPWQGNPWAFLTTMEVK